MPGACYLGQPNPYMEKLYREKGEATFKAVTQSHGRKEPLSTDEQELLALRNKVAELERFCGQLSLENSILPL